MIEKNRVNFGVQQLPLFNIIAHERLKKRHLSTVEGGKGLNTKRTQNISLWRRGKEVGMQVLKFHGVLEQKFSITKTTKI